MSCTCSVLYVGHHKTTSKEWRESCPEHGIDSAWYNSDKQKQYREESRQRSIQLQLRAKNARKMVK